MRARIGKMGKIVAGVLAGVLLFAGGVAAARLLPVPKAKARPAYSEGERGEPAGGDQLSPEGLPLMGPYERAIYDAYLGPIAVTGIFWRDFSAEDMSGLEGDTLLALVETLEPARIYDNREEELLPAGFVEETLARYFPLQPEEIRAACGDAYLPDKAAYSYPGGLGGGPAVPVVTGSEWDGKLLNVHYTWYVGDPGADAFRYIPSDSGELTLDLSAEPVRYLSNRMIGEGAK